MGYKKLFFFQLLNIGLLFSILCCSSGEKFKQKNDTLKIVGNETINKTDNHIVKMTKSDTLNICGKQFISVYDNNKFHSLKTLNNVTIIKGEDYSFKANFTDFNKDGCLDFKIEIISKEAGECEIYLYDKKDATFKKLDNVHANPELIKGTSYYFSYERVGCSDNKWQSFLSKIEGFTTIDIGVIYGNGCGDKEDGIFINTIIDEEKLIQTLPITAIEKYEAGKRGFIKSYWTNNYLKFVK